MSDTDQQPEEDGREPAWVRRKRLAQVFGEVLPDTTGDEREPGSRTSEEPAGDTWLREQVPPHHGS